MKFKYTGELPIKDVDLVLAGIFKPNQSITKGTVFEVPDNDTLLIQRVRLNGSYEALPKKVGRPKKFKKVKENEEKSVKEEKEEKEEK